ncbi:MAG: phosphoglycerate mutase family protein [Nitrososphaerota archaeon]|nr:phosphoglycerate mutase family protein [Nitrososphaerota archaeon]
MFRISTDYATFIFIRHAESEKNLQDIVGGTGDKLSLKGKQEVTELSKKFLALTDLSKRYNVISSSTLQTTETAEELAKSLKTDLIVTDAVSSAVLGIVGGLNNSQIASKYPDVFKRFVAWKNQEIEAVDLQIPGMESPENFWNRITGYLKTFSKGTNNVIVCSSSVMILVANLVLGKRPYKGGGYKYVAVNYCDTIAFDLQTDQKQIDMQTVFMVKLTPNLTTVKLK